MEAHAHSPLPAHAPPAPERAPRERNGWGFDPSIGVVLLGLAAMGLAALVGISPQEGGSLLLIPVGAVLGQRHPIPAILFVFILLAFSGTVLAYTPLSPRPAVELAILSLWAGVALRAITGERPPLWLWPAVLGPALYVLLTLVAVPLTDPISLGWESFSLSILWMSAFLMVALSPWAREYNRSIGLVVIGIAVAAGGFGVFRFLTGPSDVEEQLGRTALAGLPQSTELRFYGSQATAQQLALWCSTVLPVVFALALAWRGRARFWAAVGVGLLGFCIVATEVRTGTVAAAAGLLVTLVLFQMSRAFPGGTRAGATFTALIAIAVIGVGGFALTVGQDENRVDRFLRVLDPGEDNAYSTRLQRWEDAWPEITEKPLGQGLGTGGFVATRSELTPLTAINLDSTYLKIGLEQGIAMMVLFTGGLLIMAATLGRRAIDAPDRTGAALGIGACGTLAAAMVMFYAGFYIENLQILMAWLLLGLGVAQFSVVAPGEEERRLGGAAS
jgi:hypothetical protein